jgi:hypothetical protein
VIGVVPLGPNVNAFEDELRNFVTDVRCKKDDGRRMMEKINNIIKKDE